MAGTHIYTSNAYGWVAAESLRHLKNRLVILKYFNGSFDKEFHKDFPVGDKITVKLPDEGTIRNGLQYVGDQISRRSTDIWMDQVFGSDVQWDALEKALYMGRSADEISEEIIKPRMNKVAQEAESRAMRFAFLHSNNVTGVLGTTPTTLATYNRPRTVLTELGFGESTKKAMIMTPAMMEAVASLTTTQGLFHPASEARRAFLKGLIYEYADFDWIESMSLVRHTAGTWAGTVETSSASQSGGTLALTATTNDTFMAGDKFSIAGVNSVNSLTKVSTGRAKHFTITSATVAAASAATITFEPAIYGPGSRYQNVDALPANGADLTLWPGTSSPNGKVGTCGLAITDEAFAVVSTKLPLPTAGQELAKHVTDPDTGISISILRWFHEETMSWRTRIDVVMGFGVLRNDASVVVASAQ